MTKKKNKFDLTALVNKGCLKNGETLFFVSDPSKTCQVTHHPSGEYKINTPTKKNDTIHAFVTECLGSEPPIHASKWLRTKDGKILYDLWQSEDMAQAA